MHRIFLIFVVLAILASCHKDASNIPASTSMGNLSGTVLSLVSGMPLENVVIEIPSLSLREFSDSSGRYEFQDLPYGSYRVLFSRNGYNTDSVQLEFESNLNIMEDMYLSPKVVIANTDKDVYSTGDSIQIVLTSYFDTLYYVVEINNYLTHTLEIKNGSDWAVHHEYYGAFNPTFNFVRLEYTQSSPPLVVNCVDWVGLSAGEYRFKIPFRGWTDTAYVDSAVSNVFEFIN